MEFCDVCHNMMLVASSADGASAAYVCPNCSNRRDMGSGTHVLRVRKPQDDSALYSRFLTPALSTDPALPRAPDVACPLCSKKGGVLYVKYNPKRMLYLYHCALCAGFWKRGQDGGAQEVRAP